MPERWNQLRFLCAGVKSFIIKIKSLANVKFFQDTHWYLALLLAVLFWGLWGVFIRPWQFNNVFEPLNIFIFSVILYPIVEEIVFRGLVQDYFSKKQTLQQKYIGLSLANIMTSSLFALSHLLNQELFWALSTFFPSLIYGYFKDRHQSILPGIFLHSIFNFGFFSLIAISG